MDEKTILLIPCPKSKGFREAIAALPRPVPIAIFSCFFRQDNSPLTVRDLTLTQEDAKKNSQWWIWLVHWLWGL